ncbi:MAG: SDR family oxidoreductase [bacterium]
MTHAVRRTALVTGASAGIGRELARIFAESGFDLVLVARRRERLDALATEIERSMGTTSRVLVEDLADPGAPERIAGVLAQEGIVIDALVNNAGYGLGVPFTRAAWRQEADFLNVLLTSVVHLTHLFVPGMVERRWGRVLNVSSVAAFVPERPGDLYAPVKSFVVRFSRSLALEMEGSGVHVTALCPGFTYSEFHDVLGVRAEVSKLPRWMWMDAETVARQGYEAVMRGDPICVNGAWNRFVVTVCRLLPASAIRALSPSAALRRKAFQARKNG